MRGAIGHKITTTCDQTQVALVVRGCGGLDIKMDALRGFVKLGEDVFVLCGRQHFARLVRVAGAKKKTFHHSTSRRVRSSIMGSMSRAFLRVTMD